MNILEIKYRAALARLESLDEALGFLAECRGTDLENNINDSVIMRHRWALDATVSFCEIYLLEHLNLAVVGGSQNQLLSEACNANVITQDECAKLLMSLHDRRMPPQSWEEIRTCGIVDRIPAHYELMKTIVDRLRAQIINNPADSV
jgi:hypothetical protein